jgi:2-polyprenyl-6-methoxyphenol hydroxylase-like FAD-dependent oxidoreductase
VTGPAPTTIWSSAPTASIRRYALSRDNSPPQYAEQVVWRGVVATPLSDLEGITVIMGEGCFFGLVPVGGGCTYGFARLDAPEPFVDPPEGRLERLRSRFASLGGPVPAFLAALEGDDQLRYDIIEWVNLDLWHRGRVVLIGDAAHASPPHMGQGGTMAMEDAVVLSEVLHEASTVAEALDVFAARRRPRTDWVLEQSRAALAAWLLPPSVRDAALRERGDQMMRARFTPLLAAP